MKNRNQIYSRITYLRLAIRSTLFTISLVSLMVSTSSGQGRELTLDDALSHATVHAPAISQAYEDYRSAEAVSRLEGGLPNPVLSVGEFIEPVETRVGPQERRFSLKQSFPWFGTLGAKESAASFRASGFYQSYRSALLRTAYSVKSAYYDLQLLEQEIGLTEQNVQLLKFWESVVTTKYKVGNANHPDLIKAQVELGKLEDRLTSLSERRRSLSSRLATAANLPDSGVFLVSEFDPAHFAMISINEDSTVATIMEANPELAGLNEVVQATRVGISAASRANRPSFTLGVDYIQTGTALDPAMIDSGKDPLMVSVGLSIPLWFGKNSARKEAAEARHLSARHNREKRSDRLRTTVRELLYEYHDHLRKVELYQADLLGRARMALDASYSAYQNGTVEFISLLDAQRQLLDFELELDRAAILALKAKAGLEMLGGTNPSTLQSDRNSLKPRAKSESKE